jgi:spoIIIJ-associated protein
MNKEHLQTIKEEAEKLFAKLGLGGSVRVEEEEGEEPVARVSITTEEPKLYIGERGQTLFEIQHILKLLVRRKISDQFYLSLDINDYKKNKEEYLVDLAKTTADEVALFKREKELPPMPAAERRVIHTALSNREDVTSESAGEGLDRRVVIRVSD